MSSGQYNFYCGDMVTGKIYGQLPLINTSWADVLDDMGNIGGTVDLADPDVAAMNVPSIAAETKCWLGATYQEPGGVEKWLQAGPIWSHTYDDTTKQLTLQASGLLSYFDHRKIIAAAIGDGASNAAAAGGVTYSGFALGTIAKKILNTLSGRPNGLPPVVFQADEVETADDGHTRTYNGWDLANAGAALRDLTQALNGPEITFRPQYQTDTRFIQWAMQAGTEAQPLLFQVGPDWVFDSTLPNSPVAAINVATDGTKMGDAVWAKGNGQEASAIIGVSIGTTLTGLGYPFLELDEDGHDSVESQATINGYARTGRAYGAKRIVTVTAKVDRDASPGLNEYQKGDYVQLVVGDHHPYLAAGTIRSRTGRAYGAKRIVTVTAKVDRDASPGLNEYQKGDYVQLVVGGHHPYLAAGTIRSRIVQISGDDSNLVALQLAPVLVS